MDTDLSFCDLCCGCCFLAGALFGTGTTIGKVMCFGKAVHSAGGARLTVELIDELTEFLIPRNDCAFLL